MDAVRNWTSTKMEAMRNWTSSSSSTNKNDSAVVAHETTHITLDAPLGQPDQPSIKVNGNTTFIVEPEITLRSVLIEFVAFTARAAISTLILQYVMEFFNGLHDESKGKGEANKRALQDRLQRQGRKPVVTNQYENIIAGDLVKTEDIEVTFDMIGGLENEKKEIYNAVVLPLKKPELFSNFSKLLSPPNGVLLYGPPGTGKTMLAKAIAKESGATFINLKISTLLNKWFGESNKLVRAVFSLAQKMAPTIIFIDEVDAFLRARASDDITALSNMKAEFMALWDGLNGSNVRTLIFS